MSITPVYLESQKLDYHYYAGVPKTGLEAAETVLNKPGLRSISLP